MKNKIIRVATVSESLDLLLKGQLKYLAKFYNITAVSSPGSSFLKIKKREGVLLKPIKIKRQISLINDFVSLYKLYMFFKKEQPKIVHSITPKAGLLSMMASYFARVPIRLHTFTGLIFPSKIGFTKYLLIMMDRLLCIFSTMVYPEGIGVKQDMIKYRITNKPLRIIANGSTNGVDLDYFNRTEEVLESSIKLKTQLKIDDKDFVLCFVGRIVKDKGINELLHVFDELKRKNINLKLLLVGNFEDSLDPISNESKKIISENSSVINTGFQDDVRPYLAISDVFVFPSYREGFPNVVMQAGAMNLPCIVTDINGCNEIVENGINGLIIDPKDTPSLKNAITRLIENKSLRLKLSSNTRRIISERYDQKFVWNELVKEYQSLVN